MRTSLAVFGLLMLAACSPDKPSLQDRPDPVVVYIAFEHHDALSSLFDTYTDKTGVLVIVRRGAAVDIVDDIIENRISPPADVLVTHSVVDAWRAAEEGALRPLYSDAVREKVPAWARDPDDLWFGMAEHRAVIIHNLPDNGASDVLDFRALAKPRFAGTLCLSSSRNAINRTVLTTMIDDLDVRPTEIIVRAWIKSLALPVFQTEAELVEAIQAGSCKIGIASYSVAANSGLSLIQPEKVHADVDAFGVARHARNSDGAAVFVEWLLTQHKSLPDRGSANPEQMNVGVVAWHYEDAVKLAERARYP